MDHLSLDLRVSFERQTIEGSVVHHLEGNEPAPLRLHTRGLTVRRVQAEVDGAWRDAPWRLADADEVEGSDLLIDDLKGASRVRVEYATGPDASGLGWLEPEATTGRREPFLYTQGQCDHTRSWVPCFDQPSVRITYDAVVRVDRDLRVVMAAESEGRTEDGGYRFVMREPIPTYLIALAVGDLAHRDLGPRTGVFAEPGVVEEAAHEFADTEAMVEATERLFGPYRWGRYDILVLPPGFPLGGMENPRLTFATPTVIAGDRSLVSLVAHELAHSWSGNLVTNQTWNDFWLNEGFTVYLERRILEEIYGRDRSELEACLGRTRLEEWFLALPARDTWLQLDLEGRPPDDAMTDVPYEKGYLFLRHLEETCGRDRVDGFLRAYFDDFAFQPMTTERFLTILRERLPEAAGLELDQWIYGPLLPSSAPRATSERLERVDDALGEWLAGSQELSGSEDWAVVEWLQFLHGLPADPEQARLDALDRRYRFSESGNCEILCDWWTLCVRAGQPDIEADVTAFLCRVGRRKYLKPLYTELVATETGRQLAATIYERARPVYHPTARRQVEGILAASD